MRTLGFIARAECREVKSFCGSVLTAEGTIVTLAESDHYPQCSTGRRGVLFSSAKEARSRAPSWDGMPWYFQLKPGSLRVYEVVEVEPARAAVIEEREVTPPSLP